MHWNVPPDALPGSATFVLFWTAGLTTGQIFDSHLTIKVMALWIFPICLYGKPFICNVFHPRATWGVGPRAHVTTITHFGQNWSLGCLLALYGCIMHPAQLCDGFWTVFFLLSVSASWNKTLRRNWTLSSYTLSTVGLVCYAAFLVMRLCEF